MLIFDSFPTRHAAEKFARTNGGTVFASQSEPDKVAPFPFVLPPPIVLVERRDTDREERKVEKSVKTYGGQCAGT